MAWLSVGGGGLSRMGGIAKLNVKNVGDPVFLLTFFSGQKSTAALQAVESSERLPASLLFTCFHSAPQTSFWLPFKTNLGRATESAFFQSSVKPGRGTLHCDPHALPAPRTGTLTALRSDWRCLRPAPDRTEHFPHSTRTES